MTKRKYQESFGDSIAPISPFSTRPSSLAYTSNLGKEQDNSHKRQVSIRDLEKEQDTVHARIGSSRDLEK